MRTGPSKIGAVKLGGASLFSSRCEFEQLEQYVHSLQQDSINRWFITVGGGDTVESMRTLHRIHPQLNTHKMHWRCVQLLQTTSDAAAEIFGFHQRINTAEQLDNAIADRTPRCYLVDACCYYSPENIGWIPPDLTPAENWDTTSDTLAWLLALRVRADELHLIKKPDCSTIDSIEDAASIGLVDPQLLLLSRNKPPDWQLDTFLVYPNKTWNKKLLAPPTPATL